MFETWTDHDLLSGIFVVLVLMLVFKK